MGRALLARAAASLLALLGAALLAFVTLRVAPGDAARLVLGPFATEEAVAALRGEMGLDRPLPEQFVRYIADFATGDWGRSYQMGEDVRPLLADRFPATVELGLMAFSIALASAFALALWSVRRGGRAGEVVPQGLSLLALGVPQFWFGLMALLVGFEWLGLFPGPDGRLPAGMAAPAGPTGLVTLDALLAGEGSTALAAWRQLLLPGITLALLPFGYLTRLLRANLLAAQGSPFVLVARAHGMTERQALWRVVLPNAVIPTLTASGLILGQLLAGSVLVERVFNWPGAGALVTQGVLQQDYSVVQTFILLAAVIYILANLAVDLLAALIDPRQRSGAAP